MATLHTTMPMTFSVWIIDYTARATIAIIACQITEIFNYTLSANASWGVLTHFWTTDDPAIDLSPFSYYLDGESVPSIQFVAYMVTGAGFNDQTAHWGTKWMGKGAKYGACYNNFRVPFQRSIRVTGCLPAGITKLQ